MTLALKTTISFDTGTAWINSTGFTERCSNPLWRHRAPTRFSWPQATWPPVASMRNDSAAVEILEGLLSAATDTGDEWSVAWALSNLGHSCLRLGQLQLAEEHTLGSLKASSNALAGLRDSSTPWPHWRALRWPSATSNGPSARWPRPTGWRSPWKLTWQAGEAAMQREVLESSARGSERHSASAGPRHVSSIPSIGHERD